MTLTIDFLNPTHLLVISLTLTALFVLAAGVDDDNSFACFTAVMLIFATGITFFISLGWLIYLSL